MKTCSDFRIFQCPFSFEQLFELFQFFNDILTLNWWLFSDWIQGAVRPPFFDGHCYFLLANFDAQSWQDFVSNNIPLCYSCDMKLGVFCQPASRFIFANQPFRFQSFSCFLAPLSTIVLITKTQDSSLSCCSNVQITFVSYCVSWYVPSTWYFKFFLQNFAKCPAVYVTRFQMIFTVVTLVQHLIINIGNPFSFT